MTIKDLPRLKLQRTIEAPANTLADEAAAILGYSTGSPVVVQTTPLAAALAELDIDVLDWRAVLRYQFTKQAEENIKAMPEQDWQWRREQSWHSVPIEKYTKPIPDFVLNKAIQIKKALPACEILVEELQESADPFLVVRIKQDWRYEGYYVEVWDETSFERGR